MPRLPSAFALGMATFLLASVAAAQEPPTPPSPLDVQSQNLPPRRYEFLPVPNIGGNSDVGVELGVAFNVTHFYDNDYPYEWMLTGLFSVSFKDDANGFRAVEQSHVLALDLADLFDHRARVITTGSFTREVDARWYGLGNTTASGQTPPHADPRRYNEYVDLNTGVHSFARIKTGTIVDAAFGVNLRYESPTLFTSTKLGQDAAMSGLAGTKEAFLASASAGIVIDSRDDEFVPHRGVYYQIGGGGTGGSAEGVGYGEASAVLSSYLPLAKPITLATRVLVDLQFGKVPFYDLQQGSVFNPQYMVGGIDGVRGVRLGRYAGHAKALANYELRTTPLPKFRVAGFQVQVGTTTFFDCGRVWSDYGTPQLDGDGLGLKWGAGGGLFFQFDKSSVFRVEAAYSPDETQTSFYLASGLIF